MTTHQGRTEQTYRKKRVYYSGTDQLLTGYVLCYKHDATVGATDPKNEKGVEVTKPATANLMLFAGLVAPESNGVTGPAWVTVIQRMPEDAVTAYTKANMTKETTGLAPVDASYALGAHSDSGLNLPLVGVALETADTSTTAANKRIMFK